jgi:hypothetical protein
MKTYSVSFERLSRFIATVKADDPEKAMAEAVKAYYLGQAEPGVSHVARFSCEEVLP